MATTMPANSGQKDNVHCIHRVTRGKRHLWYQMTVLQQPERARACGSGMKANSDRRPVDPPPVVELRIIEGQSIEEGKDITFDYNANFFLYASLEQARPMVHGRVQTPAATNPPILTGVPAAGMAYLDRPTEAGYFIFPDLSVRHEGRYKLSFSLFETTKEEKDFDLEPPESDMPHGVDWRMEIKTNAFNVFSAKKFPGLMESTQLSKTVADQGCRVRIRRDVRMRKRDGKANGYDRREDDFARHRTVTPAAPEDPHGLRARSLSQSSEHRAPYGPEPQRRPSIADSYPAHPPPPPPPSYDSNQARGHLSFGDPAAPQYAQPRSYGGQHTLPPVAPVSPSGPYPPSAHGQYHSVEPQPYSYYSHRPIACASPSPHAQRSESHERRPSGNYGPPSGYADAHRMESHTSQPPLAPLSVATKPQVSRQQSRTSMNIASLVSPISLPPIEPQTEPLAPAPTLATGDKRKRDFVFHQSTHALHNGQRQQDAHYRDRRRGYSPDFEDTYYVRADGSASQASFGHFVQ